MFDRPLLQDDAFRLSEPVHIADQTAMEPDVAIDGRGQVWVAWSERGRQGDRVRLRCYGKDGPGDIIDVSTERGVEFQPNIVANLDGGVRIIWIAYRDGVWLLLTRIHNASLGDEVVVASSADGLFHPRSIVAPDGTCWIVCEKVIDRRPRLAAFHATGAQTWSSSIALDIPDGCCYRPDVANGPGNAVWVAYDYYADGRYQVLLQCLAPVGYPLQVTDNGYHNLHASLATDREGKLWIAWSSNQNDAFRDGWWLTKWCYARRFDGIEFADPVGPRRGIDVHNEDAFQGWELPAVTVDAGGRVWLLGQSSHTLYAQYYGADGWSDLFTIAPRRWGSWKPRVRVAGGDLIYIASMGLGGAQLQRLDAYALSARTVTPVSTPNEPALPIVQSAAVRPRPTVMAPDGERLDIFFGDLHAHSIYSDATNDVDEIYHRYRDAYGYDFAALTDHDFLDGIELTQSELKMMWNHCDRMTTPGAFVALYGYEWTSPAISDHARKGATVGEGHRHVLYPDQTGPLISYGDPASNTGAKLLQRLKGHRALVIPHHTSWSGTDWDAHDPSLQRLIEICSTHGRFEYAGNKPIGYRRDHIHPGQFVHDGLARGHRLGFVGGSDSHGLRWHATELEGRAAHIAEGTRVGWKEDAYRTGMTAIMAPVLTREALFDALYRRRCYATSGVPIVIDFRVDGELMGSEITASAPPHVTASVEGTGAIRAVEVVRSGQVFAGLQSRPGEAVTRIAIAFDDTMIIPGESHYYYLRVTQEDGNMGWSSPVWVRHV